MDKMFSPGKNTTSESSLAFCHHRRLVQQEYHNYVSCPLCCSVFSSRTSTTLYQLKWNEYRCANTLTTVQFMRVYQVAAYQIGRKSLMASRVRLLQIICYWTPRKLKICGNSVKPEILRINNTHLERVSQFKLLGVWKQSNLRWNYHFEQTTKKAKKRLHFLRECRKAIKVAYGDWYYSLWYQNPSTLWICVTSLGVVCYSVWRTTYSPYKTGVLI